MYNIKKTKYKITLSLSETTIDMLRRLKGYNSWADEVLKRELKKIFPEEKKGT